MREAFSNIILAASGLKKGYEQNNGSEAAQRIEVFDGIDFEIKTGETVAIVGKSGIGKSSLLHIMGALDRPCGGTLLFKGENIFCYNEAKLARFRNRSIGFVFQFHHLLKEFSAVENAMMPSLIRGVSFNDAKASAENILARVDLEHRLSHMVGKLSGGEQQRVAIARALICRPDVLLADEPTGNLDKKNSDQIHEMLMEINREMGMTMIVATHDMELASLMSRKMTIVDGNIEENCSGLSS